MAANAKPVAKGQTADGAFFRLLWGLWRKRFKGTLALYYKEKTPPLLCLVADGFLHKTSLPAPQAKKILDHAFSHRLRYAVYNADLLPDESQAYSLALTTLTFDHFSKIPTEWISERWKKVSSKIATVNPQFDPDRYGIGGSVKAVCAVLNSAQKPLGDFSFQDEATAQRAIYFLDQCGLLKYTQGDSSASGISGAEAGSADGGVQPRYIPEGKPDDGGISFPATSPPPNLTAEEKTLWDEIISTSDALDTTNFYNLLRVNQKTSPGDVKAAYYDQIKRLHPDKLPKNLAGLNDRVKAITERLLAAMNTLTDNEKKARYYKATQGGGGTPAADRKLRNVLEGALTFQRAEVYARQKQYNKALEALEKAIEHNPDEPDFHALFANVLLKAFGLKNEDMVGEIEKGIGTALSKREDHELALMTKASKLKLEGNGAEAYRIFVNVSEQNPRNVEAAREVRLWKMRHKDGGQKSSGFLSGLFKKK